MNFKNYKQVRINSLRERINKGIDKCGEFTIFHYLFKSENLSDYVSRLSKRIQTASERKEKIELQILATLEKELETCLERVK